MTLSGKNQKILQRNRADSVWPVVGISLLLLAALGVGGYFLGYRSSSVKENKDASLGVERQVINYDTEMLKSSAQSGAVLVTGQETPVTPAPEPPPLNTLETRQPSCQQLGQRLEQFFVHLDNEEYFRKLAKGKPARKYFEELGAQLLAQPPVVTRESDALYTILKNMAHFFRVIGRDNIVLIKAILDRERGKIEDVAADLYQWIITGQCRQPQFHLQGSLEKIYDYAGFFLTTMGGRSYLFRRDSRSRLLVDYYAVLVVDLANRKKMNRYGIDLGKLLPHLIEEVENTDRLIYKEVYLDRLYDLEDRYQVQMAADANPPLPAAARKGN